MVQAPVKTELAAASGADTRLLREPLILTLPEDWEPTDKVLIELSRLNEPWCFELTASGELVVMSPEGPESSERGAEVLAQIRNWCVDGGGGRFFGPQLGVRLQDKSLRMPDAAWMSDERWEDQQAESQGLLGHCPELIVEVVSRTDSVDEQHQKMNRWMRNGALLGWLIDPYQEAVSVYRPDAEVEQLERPDSLSGEDVCEGLEVSLERIWK